MRCVATLIPHYGGDCPVAVVARASWPDEVVLRARLSTSRPTSARRASGATATILVGPALAAEGFRGDSHLYSSDRRRSR
jgi:precorrin-4/cobalt-precorrin-4 C11-methyltransferase